MADEIREIFFSDREQAEANIETYVDLILKDKSTVEKIEFLQSLTAEFNPTDSKNPLDMKQSEEILSRLFSLVLGDKVKPSDMSSKELLERLADSLNTIFDSLNNLVKIINLTLQGNNNPQDTIRHIIGYQIDGVGSTQSLESYIGQITNAFLTAHHAFQKAAEKIVSQMLHEFDPQQLRQNNKGGLKFGALRKADAFERFQQKFEACQQWYKTGRFLKDFLREFEKNCQKGSYRDNSKT
jgi:hypothetical protein